MEKQTIKEDKNAPKKFGCFGLAIAVLAFLISFVPLIGAYGLGLGLFGVIFSGISYHLFRKENKSLTLPIIGLAFGITGVCMGGYQYYQYKFVFDGVANVNKKVDKGIFRLIKHYVWKEDEKVEKLLDDLNPDRHNEYFISFVDNLRVRAQPNVESEIVGYLKYGDKALSLKEESSQKDSIEIGGAMRYSNWKKVQFPSASFGDSITGWAYGGAMFMPSLKKFESKKGIHFKSVFKESYMDVSKITGLEISERYIFNGIVQFKEFYKKDGLFRLVGYSKKGVSDLPEFRNKLEIHGTFKNNKLEGLLTYKHAQHETTETILIKFEKGNCTWFSIKRQDHDVIDTHEEEDPKHCSFERIRGYLEDDI